MIDESDEPGAILVVFFPNTAEIRPHYRVKGCAHSRRGSHNTISKAGNHTSLREAENCAVKVKARHARRHAELLMPREP